MGPFNLIDHRKMGKQAASTFQNVEGYSVGLNKGFVVTRTENVKPRPSSRRGMKERAKLVKNCVKAVAGFAPYEKRAMEMFKVDNAKMEKRANRFLKKRLGSIKRAKAKSALLRELTKKRKS